jgi:aminopeptidase N
MFDEKYNFTCVERFLKYVKYDTQSDEESTSFPSTEKQKNGTVTYNWFVANPINNYGVNINIADYAHFSEIFNGEKGKLDCNYYVLKENLEKAKEQFKQAPMMLAAFEYWFGPYPFYEEAFQYRCNIQDSKDSFLPNDYTSLMHLRIVSE